MPSTDNLIVSLSPQLLDELNRAVQTGEYASSVEVVQDALRYWSDIRSGQPQDLQYVRAMWSAAAQDQPPAAAMDEALDRLENRYRTMLENCSIDTR